MIKRIDLRLEALGTDYIDLLYFHALSGKAVDYGLTGNEMDWPKSQEMKETIAAIKKTGKVRFVGFATHDQRRAEQLEIAAEGGLMDVIMIAMNPWLEKDSRLNRALDACSQEEHRPGGHEAGGRQPVEAGAVPGPDASAAGAEPLSGGLAGDLVR